MPGDPDSSEIMRRVQAEDDDQRMPPAEHGPRLTGDEINTLQQWIREGAAYTKHWSYMPVERPLLPPLDEAQQQWRQNEIDHFIARRLADAGLKPAAQAEPYTLIRRVSMDLTGLPPTVAQVDAFVADTSSDAYKTLVDRLLRDSAYGERWARVWLDLARYADSAGYANDPVRTIWGYRDWVIGAINDNMPYNQFTIEQIAGDLLQDPKQSQLVATAFHRNTLTNSEGGTNDEEFRNVAVVDRVNTTFAVWMGTTIDCAQCHTHKYDPITQEEYFKVFAYFNSTEDSDKQDEQPVVRIYTTEQQRADRIRLDAEIKRLEKKLALPSDELRAGQADWERRFSRPIDWIPLRPDHVELKSGGKVRMADDHSVLIEEPLPERETYRLILKDLPAGTTAFRLEAMWAGGPELEDAVGDVLSGFSASRAAASDTRPRGRFVRIELPGKKKRYLHLAEVQVFSDGQNIATDGVARQINTYYKADADRAIDGNTNGQYEGKSVSHTEHSVNPWWEVDFNGARPIDRIVIWNRTDPFETNKRIMPYRVTVLDEQGNVVWEQLREDYPNPSQTIEPDKWNLAIAATFAGPVEQGSPIRDVATKGANKPHAATFVLKESLSPGAGATLKIAIGREVAVRSLKRFRILATSDPFPEGSMPDEILSIVRRPPSDRDVKQTEQLASYYRSTAPELDETRNRLAMANEKRAAIKPSTHVPIMRELPPEKQRPTHIQIRGSFLNVGAEVTRGTPQVFHPFPAWQPNNRLGLAHWLVSLDNPLTARVAVNRYWAQLFGLGLVRTVEEFGSQGELPSHPELLDWLASEFMESGWDVKKLLKRIVTSATYRQASAVTPDLLARDPENRLLARGSNFRLSAEMVRDQSLAVSGLLSRKIYGPPAQPPRPNFGLKAAFGVSTDWTDSTGQDRYRRGLYTRWQRSTPYPSMAEFDAPSRVVCTTRRIRTNTPLQALVTLNDPVYIEAAQSLGRRMFAAAGDTAAKVRFGLWECLARPPADKEVARLEKLFTQCKTLFSESPADAESMATKPIGPPPQGADLADLAAWSVVGNVLLNTDEFLMKP